MFVSRCRQRIKTTIFHFHIHLVLRTCLDPRIQCNLDCHSNYSALFLSLTVSLPPFPMPIFALLTAPFDSLFEVDNICSWSVFYLLKLSGLALFSSTILLILVPFFSRYEHILISLRRFQLSIGEKRYTPEHHQKWHNWNLATNGRIR